MYKNTVKYKEVQESEHILNTLKTSRISRKSSKKWNKEKRTGEIYHLNNEV